MKSAADVWEKIKSMMEVSLSGVAIDTWFGDVEAVALEDTRLVLCVPPTSNGTSSAPATRR